MEFAGGNYRLLEAHSGIAKTEFSTKQLAIKQSGNMAKVIIILLARKQNFIKKKIALVFSSSETVLYCFLPLSQGKNSVQI